ncbi:MAG: hypothetical protein KJ957_03715 [Candidatus Omnitrophica bacterium]|nr:hypothetical protein [Candidatus Omnitrophota bacterium]
MRLPIFKTVRILYLSFFLVTILFCHNCFADFRFGVVGDSRGESKDEAINEETLRIIFKQLKSEKVEFVVFVGDMVYKSENSNKSLERWKEIV